ncbi:hypothetical protein F5B22DRAFT_600564 [Xylaria bambusicola]|uniref:uncharacterized protein n=1 Tax=Xylaria bambusicola TaxID=326684 RepID=UPI002007C340|nr:uncharacterized protein F5B22DRAFT_600564 [Xylaria bambusicola]KAI0518263.1 hypothetical protein F5B22DRAFT_600564 [Xylaria bambusicola]
MNNSRPSNYTALESLFLFQLLSKHGFINGSFDRIAQELKSTPLILEQAEYDAGRLTPDALQQLALRLVSEEQRREAEAVAEKGVNGLSPTTKKRKLQSPPLPTLKEAHEHPEKLLILVDRLYAQFRDELVGQIREDEREYQQREREIDEIEQGEWDDRIRQEQRVDIARNGVPPEKDIRLSSSNSHATPVPVPVQAPAQAIAQVPIQMPVPMPVQPRVQEQPKRVETTSAPIVPTQPPSQALHEKPPLQPSPSPLAPTTVPVPAPAPAPATPTPPIVRPTTEQRPYPTDVRPPPHEPSRVSNATTPVLQHPQMAPGYIPRPSSTAPPQSQLHAPDGALRPENLPKAKSPVPSQQGQAQAPPLKWEPLYQPPHHSPHHPPHPPPHHPPHQTSHPPPHQTPVPSPRPPYSAGPTRPQGYSHIPGSPQAPQHPHQHVQNYAGGRQTPGQSVPQSRFPTPGANAPSPPVLLPPQTGPIPPSLQSLPVNATPDGTGQHVPHQRSPSTPVVASPTPNAPRNGPTQHQMPVLPTSTPVRPPPGLATAQPATAIQPPQLPNSVRHPTSQQHSRPQPLSQSLPVPTTPSQPQNPKAAQRSFGVLNNQQSKGVGSPDVVSHLQMPIQTPVSTPQTSRPPSAAPMQTPLGLNDNSYVIRGHGTKWTSTPTPSTPRIKDVGGYFDIESPTFEPISPPVMPAQLPKTSPNAEKKDPSKSTMKTDSSKPRGRPPRSAQKAEVAPETGGASVEPDVSAPTIKDEEATPQTLQEAMDTAASETPQSRTPAAISSLPSKRKRQDSPLHRGAPTPATHVLWTRAFHKISMAALDQIIGHRYANMFANPIKPRLAPGYYDIIHRPQDLKGIQKAITAGSKAAAATVATMADIDPNSPAVWLPISIELVPPRGIINIAQLERELIHMFANAIMYNPDPQRGLGPSFLRSYQSNSEEEDLRGYEFDENGVVKETRNMFAEVEKLLGDLRNEVVPRAQAIGTGSRSVSAAVGESSAVEEDGGDEQAGDAKRRRIRG